MAVLRTVIQPLVRPMIKARSDLALGGGVGSQFVCNNPFGHEAPAFYQLDQKPLRGALVSPGSKDFLKNKAVLVDRTPEQI